MFPEKFDDAKDLLALRLRSLDPAGPDGFEGLMRDALTEITGQVFRLAKPGPQGGSDVRTVGHNVMRIGLEGKRYGADTTLRLDELQAKVVDAAKQESPVDVWILAATREISATDIEGLEQIGRDHGITVLTLDWPARSEVLPDLAVICAEAPHALASHLGKDADLLAAIAAIEAHPDFSKFSGRIKQRLLAPDVGYAAAVEAMQSWLATALSNQANSASRLGGRFNNLLDPTVKRVARTVLDSQLDQWLAGDYPAVLIGDEGVGKTWSFLSWWLARVDSKTTPPLTVFLSAKDIREEDIEALVARLLAKRLEHGDEGFWLRRLRQWRRTEFAGPQFLLVIDGLNQNWVKRDWADFLQPLYEDSWVGRFSVLLTCWPDHWGDLQSLAPLTPSPLEIEVKPFDDLELDALLTLHGMTRSQFSTRMLDLMKVPRLSLLALARQEALAASGDVTPERLAYEDWKYRIERRGVSLAITDDEFQDFVRDMGASLRSSLEAAVFTRKDLFERLGKDSGRQRADLQETVGELVAGRWLEPGDKPHHFRVNKSLVPFVLGLTLAHELREPADDAAAAAAIATFIDPLKGQSLGVAVLRAATTIALLDKDVRRPSRRCILRRWLDEQNFSQVDFDAYWRIIGLDVDLVCQITEETWLARGGSGAFADEIMIKGLVKAYGFADVAPRLVRRMTTWLGWLWEDPDEGAFIGRVNPSSDRSKSNRQRTRDSLAAWEASNERRIWPLVELRGTGDVSWFSHRVFGILSFLPREPFVDAFVAWGISRSIMGRPRHFDELSWVLRLNEDDPEAARPVLAGAIERLCATGHPTTHAAGRWLLEAIGDPEAERQLINLRGAAPLEIDTAEAELFDFVDPLDPSSMPVVEPQQASIDGAALWIHRRQTGDVDIHFEQAKPILARVDPVRLRDILGQAATSAAGRDLGQLAGLLSQLHRILIVLTPNERHEVINGIDRVLSGGTVTTVDELGWWRARRLEVQLWGMSIEEQLNLVLEDGLDLHVLAELRSTLPRIDQPLLRSMLHRFPLSGSRDTVLASLHYLNDYATDETLASWAGPSALVSSDDETIRKAAFEIVASTREPSAMEAIAASGWQAEGVKNLNERCHGSRALLAASEVLARPELLAAADPEIIAIRLYRHPDDSVALRDYDLFVRSALGDLDTTQGTIGLGRFWARHDEPMRTLVTKGTDFLPWLSAWLEEHREFPNFALFDEFPLVTLCGALMKTTTTLGIALWKRLDDAMNAGIVKNHCVRFMPMAASAGADGDVGRAQALANSITDQDLAELATSALRNGHAEWLEKTIRDGEATGRADRIARAYTLLGFADTTPIFEALWSDFELRKPQSGWLTHVYREARDAFQRNRWARHWYRAYLEATDPAASFAAYELLVAAADMRATLWIKRDGELGGLTGVRRRHWDINVSILNKSIKRRGEQLKDRLFWTKTMSRTQWPWL